MRMMSMSKKTTMASALVTALGMGAISAAGAAVTDPNFGYLGQITSRSTATIKAAGLTSPFGIGGETTDRGFSTYSAWKDYLGPLGAQKIRVQSGWNFIEKTIATPAVYDYTVLDEIIDGVRAQGVQPWLFLGYGNERTGCTDCGTAGLGGALPSGTGKTRFLNFVTNTVNRYKTRVFDWEIWNEPDGHVDVDAYKVFIVEVAKAIKAVQPTAKLSIGSFTAGTNGQPGSAGYEFAKTAVEYFAANKGATVPSADVSVSYHPYWNPVDYDSYASETTKFNVMKALATNNGFKLRDGEAGAPSAPCLYFNGCDVNWNESSQAKFVLLRMVTDFNKGIESNIFTITDLHYDSGKNPKGLLQTGTFDSTVDTPYLNGDQTVIRKKPSYAAFQNVTGVYDNRLQVIASPGCTVPYGYNVAAYTRNDSGTIRNMLAVWKKISVLPNTETPVPITITCTNFHFPRLAQGSLAPRYADLLDGRVYSTTTATITGNNAATNAVTLKTIPVGDYPVLIADQGIVLFN